MITNNQIEVVFLEPQWARYMSSDCEFRVLEHLIRIEFEVSKKVIVYDSKSRNVIYKGFDTQHADGWMLKYHNQSRL